MGRSKLVILVPLCMAENCRKIEISAPVRAFLSATFRQFRRPACFNSAAGRELLLLDYFSFIDDDTDGNSACSMFFHLSSSCGS